MSTFLSGFHNCFNHIWDKIVIILLQFSLTGKKVFLLNSTFLQVGNTSFSHNVDPLGHISSLSLHTSIIEVLGLERKITKKMRSCRRSNCRCLQFPYWKKKHYWICVCGRNTQGHVVGQVTRTTFKNLNLTLRLIIFISGYSFTLYLLCLPQQNCS